MANATRDLLGSLDSIAPCEVIWNDPEYSLFWLTTNEDGQEEALSALAKCHLTGEVAIGVSGFYLLNAVAAKASAYPPSAREIQYILLLDRSVRAEHFWSKARLIIACATGRFEVAQKIKDLVTAESERYFGGGQCPASVWSEVACESLDEEIQNGISWLANDGKFWKIQRIFQQGHFIFKRIDLFDGHVAENCERICQSLQERALTVDIFYLANVEDYAKTRQEKDRLLTCIKTLVVAETTIIHAHLRFKCAPMGLKQVVHHPSSAISWKEMFPTL